MGRPAQHKMCAGTTATAGASKIVVQESADGAFTGICGKGSVTAAQGRQARSDSTGICSRIDEGTWTGQAVNAASAPHSLKAVVERLDGVPPSAHAHRTCGLHPWERESAHTERDPGQGDAAGAHQLVGLLLLLTRRGQNENQLRRLLRAEPDLVQNGEALPSRRV